MKKTLVASAAALALALTPMSAMATTDVTFGGFTWEIEWDYFGINDVESDAYDDSSLALSIDDGVNWTSYSCRDESLMGVTELASGDMVTCDELVTVVEGLNVRGYAFVADDGLSTTVTYEITNSTASSISFKWRNDHNYGEGFINDVAYDDVFSYGDGTNSPSTPAVVAWGPTTQACSAAAGEDDGYDDMEVTSETCSLAAGATTAITIFHRIDDAADGTQLLTDSTDLFVNRTSDTSLRAAIPLGLTASNWGLAGTLDITGVPEAADPFDPTETMTLSGDAEIGGFMTVAFKNGVDPVGDYYDVWMCPNQDVKPIDGAETGECVAVTFWNRATVANYDQATTALTMTWELANEPVPGLVAEGGASYLDSNGDPILMDEPTEDGGWCAYEGWYIIVNDYDGGAHSNFSDPLSSAGCSEAALAETGVDAQSTGLVGLAALMGGIAVTVAVRRRVTRA